MEKIVGVALTVGRSDFITHRGESVLKMAPTSVKYLNRYFLDNIINPREGIENYSRVVCVMGSNTFEHMMNLNILKHIDGVVLVSSEEKVVAIHVKEGEIADRIEHFYQEGEYTLNALLRYTKLYCARKALRKVLVLGGCSVFNAFSGRYTSFHNMSFDSKGRSLMGKSLNPDIFDSLALNRTVYKDDDYMYEIYTSSLGGE